MSVLTAGKLVESVAEPPVALWVELQAEMPPDLRETLDYKLGLEPIGGGYYLLAEQLSAERRGVEPSSTKLIETAPGTRLCFSYETQGLARAVGAVDSLETTLAQMPRFHPGPEGLQAHLASSTYYHALNVEPRSPVRVPQQLGPAQLPGPNGEDLASCLFQLRETSRDDFGVVEDTLRAAFPGFERLEFPSVAAGTVAMAWRDRSFGRPLYMHQLSEGTLRFLWLTALLSSRSLPAITLLDEPEVSLHPELLSLLAGLMREASTRTQLIVATHSDRLIRALEPKEVVTFDLQDDGTATAAWADEHDLEEWLKEYTLDEVWRLGRIGGRS